MIASKVRRSVLVLMTLAVLAILLIGVSGVPLLGMDMTMGENGTMTMSDCYIPGMTAICNMTAIEHIASWQGTFVSIVQGYSSTLLLLSLFVAVAFAVVWARQQYPPSRSLATYRYRVREAHSLIPKQLQELFSQGILNPKLF